MTTCGTALGTLGTRTATPTLTAGGATATGAPPFGTPTPGHGAVAIGTATIHTTVGTATGLAIIMDIGMGTMLVPTAYTTHTTATMSSPRPTTPMVA